jgi:peptidyl-prolyl cis-trans isomerase C
MLLRAAVLALAVALLALPAGAQSTKRQKGTAPPAAAAPAPAPESAAPAAAGGDPVIAIVNSDKIHRSELQEALKGVPAQTRQQQSPDKIYMALLDQMIATTLVAQAARKAKTQDEPDVKRRLALVQEQVLAQAYIDRMVQAGISEGKLRALYDKTMATAPPREEVRARHIILASEADAKAVIDQLKGGADFVALAQEKTTDPASKASGGDLGWLTKEQMMLPEFANVAFSLKPGEFSQTPVHSKFGWHVIKVEDRRKAPPPTIDELRPQLTEELARQMIAEKMKELKTAAKIEVFNGDGSRPAPPKPATPPAAQQPPQAPVSPEDAPPTLSPATKPKE